ncbi:MAG TPA: class I SAM-dependent methyltransferase [Candidatus Limnocylindrales bacterium]|nr:class I SAM-dependent methyltransferase [Candidatus Limnocylindrales bacterium]
MTYRATFDCLWCGTAWTTRGLNDLEGWALLCPTCLGRAGSNPFLKGRLRKALADRVSASQVATAAALASTPDHAVPHVPRPEVQRGSRAAPAYPAFPDDWFLRRGAFERGAIHDAAWAAELDMVTRWLDGLPLAGRIVEAAAGVGFFSPLLAERGELSAYDTDAAALDRARDRLLAHRLRAHLHIADPFAVADQLAGGAPAREATPDPGTDAGHTPDPGADAIVAAFLLGRVRGAGLDLAAASLRARLRPGGRLALIDLRPEPAGGPPPGIAWTWHDPALVEAALGRAGFAELHPSGTGRFFLTVSAVAR